MPSLLDFFETRRSSAKRQKVSHDVSAEASSAPAGNESVQEATKKLPKLPALSRKDTESVDAADLSVGNEDSGNLKSSQTELETSLPAITVDEDAIKEYETARAAEIEKTEDLSLEQRLQERKWRKGKSSIYVDAFNLALETVLNEEAHLFDQSELDVFKTWKELSYEAQYLSVTLCHRSHPNTVLIDRLCY